MKSSDIQSSDELRWLDSTVAHQDSGSSNGRQGDMPQSRYGGGYNQGRNIICFDVF